MNPDNRGTYRLMLESQILILFHRGNRSLTCHGRVCDVSEGGFGVVVAEELVVGETVSLLLLPTFKKSAIEARVARHQGAHYSFEFTSLTEDQRAIIRRALSDQNPTGHFDESNLSS